jgi:[acyl-carrier-protein] S-malonyltransferase
MTNNVAFFFPGHGSQKVGKGKALSEAYPAARKLFSQANEILEFDLSRLCFVVPEAELNDTINTQAAIYVTSMAVFEALKEGGYGVKPSLVAGHSLGEYSAYAAAGVFSFADGLRLVRERGRLMKKAGTLNPGGMAAILKLEDDTVAEICRQVSEEGHGLLQVANYNSPGQVVVSGHSAAVDRGIELALQARAKRAVKLPVSIAAHSELMRVVAEEFREAINRTPLNLPDVPIVANITAEPLVSVDAIRAEMEDQLTSSVRWTDSVLWMADHNVTEFVEIGPKEVLAGLIRRISKDVKVSKVGVPQDITALVG